MLANNGTTTSGYDDDDFGGGSTDCGKFNLLNKQDILKIVCCYAKFFSRKNVDSSDQQVSFLLLKLRVVEYSNQTKTEIEFCLFRMDRMNILNLFYACNTGMVHAHK